MLRDSAPIRKTDSEAVPSPPEGETTRLAEIGTSSPDASLDTSVDGAAEPDLPTSTSPETPTSSARLRGRASDSERVILLAPHRPVLCDLVHLVDGQPLQAGLTTAIADLLAQIAADQGTNPPTWQDALTSGPLVRVAGVRNPNPASDRDVSAVVAQFDSNRNGRIEPDELRRYLARDRGAPDGFTAVGFNTFRERNRDHSRLGATLDADGNGRLDAAEIAGAAERLLAWDADRDGMIRLADLPTDTERPIPERRRLNEPSTVLHLRTGRDGDLLAANLSERYAFGGSLTSDDLTLWPEPRGNAPRSGTPLDLAGPAPISDEALDADGNGRISVAELARLADVTARLRLTIGWDRSGPSLMIETPDPPGGFVAEADRPVVTVAGTVARIAFPGEVVLLLRVTDLVRDSRAEAIFDGLIQQTDPDAETLAVEAAAPLAATFGRPDASELDTDGDGRISRDEVQAAARATFADRPYQVRLVAAEHEDVLWPWLDLDGDGVLSGRELAHASERLTNLAGGTSGTLRLDQVPECLTVLIERGFDQPAVRPPSARFGPLIDPDTPSPPPWFSAMDSGGDGLIDRREFLGTPEQFDLLDTDGDGFLTPAEAIREK